MIDRLPQEFRRSFPTALRTVFFKSSCLVLIIILLTCCLIAGPSAVTRHYLSEFDFLNDYRATADQVHNRDHLVVEFSNYRVAAKYSVDELGDTLLVDRFTYKNGQVDNIRRFRNDNFLIRQTAYGLDSLARAFIEYNWGISISQRQDDHFTTYYYNHLEMLDSVRFNNPTGQVVGLIIYQYDGQGNIISEQWLEVPGRQVVRQWINHYDRRQQIKRAIELDDRHRVISDRQTHYSGAVRAVRVLFPRRGSAVRDTKISYRVYSGLDSARVTLSPLPASPDSIPVISHLYLSDLTTGDHLVDLALDHRLLNQSLYRLTFSGVTDSGQPILPQIVDSIRFDTTPPALDLRIVATDARPRVALTASERLKFAQIIYRRGDDEYPVVLTASELDLINDSLFTAANQLPLDPDQSYSAWLKGQDYAGNWANSPLVGNIYFDTRPPRISVKSPQTGQAVNRLQIVLSAGEPLYSVNLAISGGDTTMTAKRKTAHSFDYTRGDSIDFSSIIFEHDDRYTLEIWADDLSGQISDTVYVSDLTGDTIAPLITPIFPFNDAVITETTVSYIFSETLSRAEFLWLTVAGEDSIEQRNVLLVGDELSAGEKIHRQLHNYQELVVGAVYDLVITGVDQAGNSAVPVRIKNIHIEENLDK